MLKQLVRKFKLRTNNSDNLTSDFLDEEEEANAEKEDEDKDLTYNKYQ